MAKVFASPMGQLVNCRPLILAPSMDDRRMLREALTYLGCASVSDACQPRQAWAALEQGDSNMLFLDWSSKIDALAFLHSMRSPESPSRFLPVVVMTAYDEPAQIAAIRDAGASELMVRPWSADQVASRLSAIQRQQRLFIEGGGFFGPDRRRRKVEPQGEDRRSHENWRSPDRRRGVSNAYAGPERRQGLAGFMPLERRNAPRA